MFTTVFEILQGLALPSLSDFTSYYFLLPCSTPTIWAFSWSSNTAGPLSPESLLYFIGSNDIFPKRPSFQELQYPFAPPKHSLLLLFYLIFPPKSYHHLRYYIICLFGGLFLHWVLFIVLSPALWTINSARTRAFVFCSLEFLVLEQCLDHSRNSANTHRMIVWKKWDKEMSRNFFKDTQLMRSRI